MRKEKTDLNAVNKDGDYLYVDIRNDLSKKSLGILKDFIWALMAIGNLDLNASNNQDIYRKSDLYRESKKNFLTFDFTIFLLRNMGLEK